MHQWSAHQYFLLQVPTSLLLDSVGRDKIKRSTTQQTLQLALPQVGSVIYGQGILVLNAAIDGYSMRSHLW